MHTHHILPRSAGGTDELDNLVEVTVEEHAEIHRCLWVYADRWQDELAWRTLSGHVGREEAIRLASSRGGQKGGRKNKGRKFGPYSEERKQKLRKPNTKKKILSKEHKQKLSDILKGRPKPIFTETHRQNIAKAKFGNQNARKIGSQTSLHSLS